MARRMRELDWSRTALGPVERWPQALRTSVSTCLDCAFPIVLWWGPELVILYNDEYVPMLGAAKHPIALGQPGAVVWTEIWDVIQPMLGQVMERAEATRSRDLLLHIDRGYPEEAYFSFSYSPIHDEHGKVGGVFCPVIETTEKVIGERRLRTLRDVAARCKGAETEQAAYDSAAAILAGNPHDVPFALIYRVDESQAVATLEAAAGIAQGAPAAPARIALDLDVPDIWSLSTVARSGQTAVVNELRERWSELPTGAWQTAPSSALVLPIWLPGQDRPRAILVAAVSPMRALDEDYRTFFGLVATQIAAGLADAQALEAERRRTEALAELDRAKTVFFSNVSHEFRTPLSLMIGPLEDLLASPKGALPEWAISTLTLGHRNALRLLKLVNTLLDFSRIEAGRIDASYEPTDLAGFTAELASVFRSAIEQAGLRFTVDCPPLPEPVYVDRDMWEKIVLNLLSNACKFTFDGEIVLSLRHAGEHVELSVADTGIGIAASDLPRMFERFHRVKNARARTHEGTGIGLALVHELVKLHGGSTTVHSEEGRGTTFTVRIPGGAAHLPAERITKSRALLSTSVAALPFVDEAQRWLPTSERCASSIATPVAEIPAGSVAAPGSRTRVLLADDNADMRDYLGRLLGQSYRVETVADGQSALERIQQSPPDLVLSDVMMPNLDGFGLLAAIRGDERTRSLPVILLSARAGEEARIEGLRAGADAYIVKPFSARELLARVDSQLALSRQRQENERSIAESERLLREADRRKDEFIALLAHELRNPLAPIRTGLELLRVAGDAPETVSRVRAIMERQVSQMVRLIDDLLDISRITSGKIVLQRTPTPLNELIENVLETQRSALRDSGLELVVELPDQPCVIDVDPTRFVQILSNVIHNALKFTPRGRIRVRAEVEPKAGAAARALAISVCDTGVGISRELLPKIFELFTQGEALNGRMHGGLGIGLSLSRRLVEMHGGRIDAHSDGPGCGSTFVITLPVCEAPKLSAQAPRDDRTIRCRALIIDDNRDAAETVAMLVEQIGGAARTAHDAVSGLAAVAEFEPDIVLLDLGMPGIDGYEACRRIRLQQNGRPLAIAALTGWGQPQDRQRAFDAGFDSHLTKPVDPALLHELLSTCAPLH
jgi:signal transduction histidine kinase